ncbi:HIT-like domain-containing protein [Tricharina praecox]|uniref:HIT-like domain-containing protein n=1 Tax=Tricharina praecox TaxID=43433 RepID=UPI00221E45EA|nr:HIT-like domain-containing protein [Tricharina praecox]KAI5849207.1 HIT-like domain-containing protein [Tricharina praecox]
MESPEEKLLRSFVFGRLLNQDTRTKTVNLLGKIDSQSAIVIAEKTAFTTDPEFLESFSQPSHLSALSLVERNDIYHWFLASQATGELPRHAEAKLTLIFPATETHIRKYSVQSLRMVTETPEIYREHVLPYVSSKRGGGRLNWVYNVLEKKRESESIIIEDTDEQEGFMLLPDLKWDRRTMSSLYTMALVLRRDITSVRDLKKKDVPWLRRLQKKILEGICDKYSGIEADQIRLYIHYQPSYYHFHIHAVAISHDGGGGQAAGKAMLLQNVISQLEGMAGEGEVGFADVELTYFVGEESELWQNVFSKLKK